MNNDKPIDNMSYENILHIVRSDLPLIEIRQRLEDFHDRDIAEVLHDLTDAERENLFKALGIERFSDVFSYLDDGAEEIQTLPIADAAEILANMDSDDAVDILEKIDSAPVREKLLTLMGDKASKNVKLIRSYEEDTIGNMMTTNYILIPNNVTVKSAMRRLIKQAEENDNVSTIYVKDENDKYYGAIDLRKLIIARENTALESIIQRNYPFLRVDEKIEECIEDLKNYSEDSLPVLNQKEEMVGVITAQDVIEAVDDEMSEDYAKFAGLTAEEVDNKSLLRSAIQRLPWLILLLFLGMGVSSVVGLFEKIVMELTIIMSFQSLVLDMAGNVGTQSLAVTIRILMDKNITGREKFFFMLKELEIGAINGLILGGMSLILVTFYLTLFKGYLILHALPIAVCVGLALCIAMLVSGLVGSLTPIFFDRIHVDPAVASGPLITTINDLVAVVTYYGLAAIFLLGHINLR